MSFGGFGFHGDVFVGNVYSSGVLLIIITQLADNFDVIQRCMWGVPGSSCRVSCLQTWQRTRGEYGEAMMIPVRADHDSGQGCEA